MIQAWFQDDGGFLKFLYEFLDTLWKIVLVEGLKKCECLHDHSLAIYSTLIYAHTFFHLHTLQLHNNVLFCLA